MTWTWFAFICCQVSSIASLTGKLKDFANSGEDFTRGFFNWRHNSNRHNPIEILKRLQRESFSDLMKLRDRQDKVERMISFFQSTKGSPFREVGTHVKGEIDVVGSLLIMDDIDQQNCDTLGRAGIRTGVDSRFTFETTVRQKDTLATQFVANHSNQGYFGDSIGSPLSLTKVIYLANVCDWFSMVVIPVGARCKDVAVASNGLLQERSLTDFSSFGPPILDKRHSTAIGLMVKRSNITAAVAEFVSRVGMQNDSVGITHCFSSFGQVIYQISKGTKFTLLGLRKHLNGPCRQHVRLTVPVSSLQGASADTSPVANQMDGVEDASSGCVALMVESELDDCTRIGGWVEMQSSSPRCMQWAVTLSDTPEEGLGWGLSLGGIIQGPSTWDHFQVEAFLKLHMGKRFSLQPGFVYVMDGTTRIPALMFRSSWSL